MKKKILLISIILVITVGAFTIPIFPDPYHQEGNVTFITWLEREIRELIQGEK